jgi:predicted nucleic acid-binding Zn ribbon protein
MPHNPDHERKKQKNIALLFILIAMAVLFYAITLVKFKG